MRTYAAIFLLMGISMAFLSGCEDWGTKDIEEVVSEAINDERPLTNFVVSHKIGLAYWEGGRTNLVVNGDGTVNVENSYQGTARDFSGIITATEFKELLELIHESKLWDIEPSRELGVPDESKIDINVMEKEENIFGEISIWQNEAHENPKLEAVVLKLREITKKISSSQVF